MTNSEIIQRLKEGDLQDPIQLSNFLIVLSASRADAKNFEIDLRIDADKAWRRLKESPRENGKEKTDTYVDREWTSTPEWKEWKRAENANDSVEDVIMSLKKKLSVSIF